MATTTVADPVSPAVAGPEVRAPGRPGWRTAAAFLVVASVVGGAARGTVLPGQEFATVWPAAGVTVLWLLVRRAGLLSVDTALMFVSMLGFGLLSGIPAWQAVTLAGAHALQTMLVVGLLRRFLPGLGETRTLDSPRMLARYLACITAGVVVSAIPVTAVWLVAADPDTGVDMLLWTGRNICGILLVTTVGLLLADHLARPRPRPRLWEGSTLEFLAACLSSVAVFVVVFVLDTPSLLFLVLGVLIWCGVRFGTLMNSLHLLVLGYLAVWATLQGVGPFTESDPTVNALLVQFFVVATASVSLALSTGMDERRALHARLLQSSQEMTYQAQLLDAVVGSMAEGLVVVDDAGRWLLRNPAATRVGGLAGDLQAVLSSGSGVEDPLTVALAGGTVRDRELIVSGPPGAGRILAVSATPLPRDSVTGRARALLIFRDATVEHARRIDLTAFAEVVAHDLRNPLAAVESWTEMMAFELEEGGVEPDLVTQYVDRVGNGTRRMTALIEDLLGRATQDSALRLRRLDVARLAEEVADDHGATDVVKVGDIPAVRADEALVRQVLENLLGNALKFVEPGREPDVTVTGRRTDSGTVAVAVADHGVGLPPGAHERVFDDHHRAHPSYEGRGLGLAICRRIVERHGGSITARNNPDGQGAVFELTLPSAD